MKNRKYVLCSGLAFADVEDMETLHQYALDGWIFREFKWLCYVLHKEEPQNLIFSYDMQKVNPKEAQDYMQMFEEAGWHRIDCKDRSMHFFYAEAGTKPLHSDKETRREQFLVPFYASVAALLTGFILLLCTVKLHWEAWLVGLGGGLIGGGGVLFAGCALRLRNKRWKAIIPFRKALLMFLMGLSLWVLGRLLINQSSMIGSGLKTVGILLAIPGGIFVLVQYRVYKDKKEIGGKLDD